MTEINASPGRILSIGYESEDNVTKIIFRYDSEWLSHGDGVFKVRVLRNGDAEAYNATQVVDDREAMTLTMTVTNIELSVKGHGEMQIVYIGSDFVKKSPVYRYNVSRAIDSEIVNPPQGSIINELLYDIGDLTELTTTNIILSTGGTIQMVKMVLLENLEPKREALECLIHRIVSFGFLV